MGAKKASIRDVAALAGVSLTTVSHVLNDVDTARVAEDTRIRVREAAAQLAYTPNRLARGLRLQRSHTIALVGDNIATSPYAVGMILGAQETALQLGFLLLLFNTAADPETERLAIRTLEQYSTDGVIYATMYHREVSIPAALHGVPTVLLDAESRNSRIPAVVPDEFGGARAAVEHLLRHGHRRIGFINNCDDIPATHARLRGYTDTLVGAGIRADSRLVVTVASDTDAHNGYIAARRLLKRRQRPTALFCFNDRVAMGAYRAASELGLRIPGDLSVVGFDDQTDIATGLVPALTTVALPHYEMGKWAVEKLIDLVENRTGSAKADYPYAIACPLVSRASVSSPPG